MGLVVTGIKTLVLTPAGYQCVTNPTCLCTDNSSIPAPVSLPTGTTQFTIPVTSLLPPKFVQFTIDAGTGQTLQQYTISITPPAGFPQYTIVNAPSGATQQFPQYTLNPNTGVITIPLVTIQPVGVFKPFQNFTVYPGGQPGVWTVRVINTGANTGTFSQFVIGYTVPIPTFTISTVAVDTGGGGCTLQFTVGGTGIPTYVSIDWGDGGTPQHEWFNTTTDKMHTYVGSGPFTITSRLWNDAGAYVEDTTVFTPSTLVGCDTYQFDPGPDTVTRVGTTNVWTGLIGGVATATLTYTGGGNWTIELSTEPHPPCTYTITGWDGTGTSPTITNPDPFSCFLATNTLTCIP